MAALRIPAGLKLLRRLVPPPTRPLASQYDYVIVGAGSAGWPASTFSGVNECDHTSLTRHKAVFLLSDGVPTVSPNSGTVGTAAMNAEVV